MSYMAIAPRSAEELLREVNHIKELSSTTIKALGDAAEVRKAARGAALFAEGQQAEGLWVVRTGEVKLTKSGRDGREQILYLARPGKPMLEGVRFDGGIYPASAIAMRAATAVLFPNDLLKALSERDLGLMVALLNSRAHRSDRTLALVSDLSLRTVPARLASFLCTLIAMRDSKGQDSKNLVRDLTTETVAGRLGTVREEISRGLAFLERQGALKVSPDLIEIVDPQKLEQIAFGPKKASSKAANP